PVPVGFDAISIAASSLAAGPPLMTPGPRWGTMPPAAQEDGRGGRPMRRTIGRIGGATSFLAVLLAATAASACANDADAGAVLTIEIIRPDRQLDAVLGLFRGSRAANPAAAMASWRRATG